LFANFDLKPDALHHFLASLVLIIPAFLLVQDFQNYIKDDIKNGFLERYLTQPSKTPFSYITAKLLSYICQIVIPFALMSGGYLLLTGNINTYIITVIGVFFMSIGFISMGINFSMLRVSNQQGIIGYMLIPLQMPAYLMFLSCILKQILWASTFFMGVGLIFITLSLSLIMFDKLVYDAL
jgi:hypothetical protein